MKKIESIYREILYRAIEKKEFQLTQSELSKELVLSLSIVNLAIKKLKSIGAVKINQRSFNVLDIKKILYFWASARNLEKDIIFKARIEMPVREIERNLPDIIFTAYTAYKFKFNDVPADYSEVYAYADEKELESIKKRFKIDKDIGNKKPNLFILKKDNSMNLYKSIPVSQIFIDLWNLKEWYAKEFINEFEKRIGEK